MNPRLPLPTTILDSKVIAVLRAPTPNHLVPVALELFDLGVHCLEIALSTPGALDAIEELKGHLGANAALGAGTVLTEDNVRRTTDAGASYLLSPVTDASVIEAARQRGMPFVPGAGTATEIATGWALGASAVKVFPAQSLGGSAYIKSIRDPLPLIQLMPTGGVAAAEVAEYLAAGAIAVGVGSPLTGDALRGGSIAELRVRVRRFLAATRQDGAK